MKGQWDMFWKTKHYPTWQARHRFWFHVISALGPSPTNRWLLVVPGPTGSIPLNLRPTGLNKDQPWNTDQTSPANQPWQLRPSSDPITLPGARGHHPTSDGNPLEVTTFGSKWILWRQCFESINQTLHPRDSPQLQGQSQCDILLQPRTWLHPSPAQSQDAKVTLMIRE